MLGPPIVYLDSSDYSALSDANKPSPEMARSDVCPELRGLHFGASHGGLPSKAIEQVAKARQPNLHDTPDSSAKV